MLNNSHHFTQAVRSKASLVLFSLYSKIASVKKFPSACFLAILLALFTVAKQGKGYALEGSVWPAGSNVIMRLGLGPTPVMLEDGLGSWNASAADAVAIWNGYLDFIHFASVSSSTVPQRAGDHFNSVFFSNSIFGDSFGTGTLAVTVLQGPGSQHAVVNEADVIVNSAYRYNSYRGPLHSDARGQIFDIHRIFLHEFGHVLDLDHVVANPAGTHIMEPNISDWDHLDADAISGARNPYGASFYSPNDAVTIRIQSSLDYFFRANNNPTLFSTTLLPPGLTFHSNTGQLTGNAIKGGVYDAAITGRGPRATAYTSFQLKVLGS